MKKKKKYVFWQLTTPTPPHQMPYDAGEDKTENELLKENIYNCRKTRCWKQETTSCCKLELKILVWGSNNSTLNERLPKTTRIWHAHTKEEIFLENFQPNLCKLYEWQTQEQKQREKKN